MQLLTTVINTRKTDYNCLEFVLPVFLIIDETNQKTLSTLILLVIVCRKTVFISTVSILVVKEKIRNFFIEDN